MAQSLGCKPIAHPDSMTADMLGSAELVEEMSVGGSKIIKVLGAAAKAKTVSILVRGSNRMVGRVVVLVVHRLGAGRG